MAVLYSNSTLNPPTTPPWVNNSIYASQMLGQFRSLSANQAGPYQQVPEQYFDGEGHSKEIETKLRSLAKLNADKTSFFVASSDDVVRELGDVDPIFGKSMISLAEALLRCAPDPRGGYRPAIAKTGLFYEIPHIFGMPYRIRTSYVGLALLDHWSMQNRRFAPYVDAYIDHDVRDSIAADCFALGMGHMPKWIKEAIEHGEKARARYEAKVERRRLVEEQKAREEYQRRMQEVQAFNKMTAYYDTLNQRTVLSSGNTSWVVDDSSMQNIGLSTPALQNLMNSTSVSTDQKKGILQRLIGKVK